VAKEAEENVEKIAIPFMVSKVSIEHGVEVTPGNDLSTISIH